MKGKEKMDDEVWKRFLRKHWQMTLVFILMIAAAAVIGLTVFLWVLASAQATGFVPAIIGEWSVGHCISFCLTVLFWELIFVASWVIPAAAVIYFQWYKRLPEKEQEEYGRDSKSSSGDGFSFVVGLIWLGIVWFTGRWSLPFQSWTINDWVYTWLIAGVGVLAVAGILGTMYMAYALSKDTK